MAQDVNVRFKVQGGDKVVKGTKALNKSLGGLQKTIVKVGAAITAGFSAKVMADFTRSSVREFARFNSGIAEVGTLSDEVRDNIDGFRDALLKVSVDTAQPLDRLQKGMFDAISAGVPAADAIEFMGTAGKLAVAGVTNVSVAVDGLTSLINAYGIQAEKASMVADKLFTAQRFGKTTVEELSGAVGKLAPITAAAGVSMDEMLAALSRVTLAGISTDEATTSLVSVMQSFLAPQEAAVVAARKLGIELSSQALRTKGLAGVLEQVSKAEGDQIDIANALGITVRGLKGILSITSDEMEGFNKILGGMGQSAGATNKAFADMSKQLQFQLDQLSAAFKKLLVDIGGELAPEVEKLIKGIMSLLEDNTELIKSWASAIVSFMNDQVLGMRIVIAELKKMGKIELPISKQIKETEKTIEKLRKKADELIKQNALARTFTFASQRANELHAEIAKLTKKLKKLRKAEDEVTAAGLKEAFNDVGNAAKKAGKDIEEGLGEGTKDAVKISIDNIEQLTVSFELAFKDRAVLHKDFNKEQIKDDKAFSKDFQILLNNNTEANKKALKKQSDDASEFSKELERQMVSVYGDIGRAMGEALTGGFDVEQTFASIGASLGKIGGAALGSAFGPAGAAIGGELGAVLGETLGKAVGGLFGGGSRAKSEFLKGLLSAVKEGTSDIQRIFSSMELGAGRATPLQGFLSDIDRFESKMDDFTKDVPERYQQMYADLLEMTETFTELFTSDLNEALRDLPEELRGQFLESMNEIAFGTDILRDGMDSVQTAAADLGIQAGFTGEATTEWAQATLQLAIAMGQEAVEVANAITGFDSYIERLAVVDKRTRGLTQATAAQSLANKILANATLFSTEQIQLASSSSQQLSAIQDRQKQITEALGNAHHMSAGDVAALTAELNSLNNQAFGIEQTLVGLNSTTQDVGNSTEALKGPFNDLSAILGQLKSSINELVASMNAIPRRIHTEYTSSGSSGPPPPPPNPTDRKKTGAFGGDFIVNRPTPLLVGENNRPERVNIQPLSAGGGKGSGGININFYGPAVIDEISASQLANIVASRLRSGGQYSLGEAG